MGEIIEILNQASFSIKKISVPWSSY